MTASINPGDRVVVRSRDAGVFFGTLVSKDGDEVTLAAARRLWYWSGAASLSELSQSGVASPKQCKFPMPVPVMAVMGVCEIIPVSDAAGASLDAVPVWTSR